MSAAIDLQDPAVQRLLAGDGAQTSVVMPGSQRKMAMTQIAGDEHHGISSTQYLDRGKQEVALIIRPKNSATMVDGIATVDVYAIPGEPLKVHMICPRCKHQLQLDQARKAMEWNPTAPNPHAAEIRGCLEAGERWIAANLGVLSVSEFQCTWELANEMQDGGKDEHVIVGGSLCRYRAVIERNVLKEV